MSGSLRVVTTATPLRLHDHVDFVFEGNQILRFNDPRRFGSIHWQSGSALDHPLLHKLGPEPLNNEFDGDYLFTLTRSRTMPIKNFIMNSHHVVGVGNIYANEALFRARIRPTTPCSQIGKVRLTRLAVAIKETLLEALDAGGTTLRNYVGSNGEPGLFELHLDVYGRAGKPCNVCGNTLKGIVLGQRQTVYCSRCQRR